MPRDCRPAARKIYQLAMNLASKDSVRTLDDVVTAMQVYIPAMNREVLVENINEASAGQEQETSEVLRKLAAIKKEAFNDQDLRVQVAQLERYLQNGDLPPAARKNKSVVPDPIKMLREVRDNLKRKLANTPVAHKAKLTKQIAALDQRIATGNIGPQTRIKATPMDREIEEMEYQVWRRKKTIRAAQQALKPKTTMEHIENFTGVMRALKTTVDLSGLLRQGGFQFFSHPVRGVVAAGKMLQAFGTAKSAYQINEAILDRYNAPMYAKSKLYLSPLDNTGSLSKREEAFSSDLYEGLIKLLKASKVGKPAAWLLEGSERAYITVLNQMRADAFDGMVATLGGPEGVTQQQANVIASYVNASTGRGKIEKAAAGLSTVFFAPRFTMSRFQMATGAPLLAGITNKTDRAMKVRALIAADYARFALGISLVYYLAKLAGGEFEDDPTSSDFGKIRFGNTRLDPLSGMSQSLVLLARLYKGEVKSTWTGKTKKLRGPDASYGSKDIQGILSDFFKYKLAPAPSMALSLLAGKDAIGRDIYYETDPATGDYILDEDGNEIRSNKVLAKYLAINGIMPLSFGDVYDAMREQGAAKGTALTALALLGMATQTYGKALDTMTLEELEELRSKKVYKSTRQNILKGRVGAYKSEVGYVQRIDDEIAKRKPK